MALGDAGRGLQLPLGGCWSLLSISEALIHVGVICLCCRCRWGWCSASGRSEELLFGLRYPLPLLIMGFSEMEQENRC